MTEGGIAGLAATIGALREDVARLRRFAVSGRQSGDGREAQLDTLMREGMAQVGQMRQMVDMIGAHPDCTPETRQQLDELRQLLKCAEFDLSGITSQTGPVAPLTVVKD
jgi:hypothetical protein